VRAPAPAWWAALVCVSALLPGCDREDPTKPRPPAPEPATHPTGDTSALPTDGSLDSDGDGWPDNQDCAPDDPLVNPFAAELCNGVDDNCDGVPDPIVDRDGDGDGFLWCRECDDLDPTAHPGAPDPIDGIDQDCDGTDGQGDALADPAYLGTTWRGLLGFELAAADFDGDGCDDLLIGQPSDPTLASEGSTVSLRPGCSDGALLTNEHGRWMGTDLDLAPGLLVFTDPGFDGVGRALVFDPTFGPAADAVLEVVADGGNRTGALTFLGSPPEWLLLGTGGGKNTPAHLNLLDASRTGAFSFLVDTPDVQIWTDSSFAYSGAFVADVGDRDGDGSVDLAYGMPDPAIEAVFFFPDVYAAHIDDAPEVWLGGPQTLTGFGMGGDADLDGDGLVDGLAWSAEAQGEEPGAGVVYVVPWRGPGEHTLDGDAPARIEGEFTFDGTGAAMRAADLDGDDIADLVVGAPGDWVYTIRAGKVMVFSGPLSGTYTAADADRLWVGEHLGDHAGRGLALGDFDSSGQRDIAIGAPFALGDADIAGGAVYILWDPL
jgi:hypothetical protein